MFIFLAQLVTAQVPTICQKECARFDISSCKQPNTPSTPKEWEQVGLRLAECICPIIQQQANSCGACLISKASEASGFYTNLQSKCIQKSAKKEILQLWNIGKDSLVETGPTNPSVPPVSPRGSAGGVGLSWELILISMVAFL